MPYFLRGKCVWKGTKKDPVNELKCHETRRKALAHLAALVINVDDVTKDLYTYKDVGAQFQDRWLTVSTVAMWDREDQMLTEEAMDKDIARALRTGVYPEYRLFHVRGFKLGMCDHMQRIGKYGVEQGYWFNTPFAQAMKDIVANNTGKWKVSRGFHSLQAAGQCPVCGNGLSVGLMNYIFGIACSSCKEYFAKPSMLARLRHINTNTYDITVTDVPVVVDTSVIAYTLS